MAQMFAKEFVFFSWGSQKSAASEKSQEALMLRWEESETIRGRIPDKMQSIDKVQQAEPGRAKTGLKDVLMGILSRAICRGAPQIRWREDRTMEMANNGWGSLQPGRLY